MKSCLHILQVPKHSVNVFFTPAKLMKRTGETILPADTHVYFTIFYMPYGFIMPLYYSSSYSLTLSVVLEVSAHPKTALSVP